MTGQNVIGLYACADNRCPECNSENQIAEKMENKNAGKPAKLFSIML